MPPEWHAHHTPHPPLGDQPDQIKDRDQSDQDEDIVQRLEKKWEWMEKMKSLIWRKLTGRNWRKSENVKQVWKDEKLNMKKAHREKLDAFEVPQAPKKHLKPVDIHFFLNHSHHHLKLLVFRISISILWYSVRDILIWNCVGSTPEKHHNTKIFTRLRLLYKCWPWQYWKYRLKIKSLIGASWSSKTCISRVLVWSLVVWEEGARNRGAHQVAELVAVEAAI